MALSYLYLSIAAFLPILASIIFFLLEKHTKFKELNYWVKQVIFGVVFGGLAIVGTHWSIPFNGAAANARDAAVIIAGLGFGAPAGLIAGTLGGLERMIVGLAIPAKFGYTVVACSLSTFLAGVISAIIRKFAFRNKRAKVVTGFFTGLVIEVFHLFMVFVTNAGTYQKAFNVVMNCTPPMLVANSLAVMFAMLALSILENGKKAFKKPDTHTLNNRFTLYLSILTLIVFALSSTFIVLFQNTISTKQTQNSLTNAITDVKQDISDHVDTKTLDKGRQVKELIEGDFSITATPEQLQYFAELHDVCEINIVEHGGVIVFSNITRYIETKFNLSQYEQSRPFMVLANTTSGVTELVQEFRPMADDPTISRKYCGFSLNFTYTDGLGHVINTSGLIQVGLDEGQVDTLVKSEVTNRTMNTHVGETGSVLIYDFQFDIVSISKTETINPYDQTLLNEIKTNQNLGIKEITVGGKKLVMSSIYESGYYIVSLLPQEDAYLTRNIAIVINTFLEIIVFGLFFILTYFLVKKLVIDPIESTNNSLAKIKKGDLDEVVKHADVTEFEDLASGINSTVTALKGYIDAANKRIDEELAFAKAIQTAVLPSTFPAFPDRPELDIYASMHTAKQVGGDFYDFYFSNQELFHFTIADVSGKGIPAALFMMRAKAVLKSLTQTNIPINDVFAQANDALCDGNEAQMFVTAWSATIDLRNGTLTFANGGHNPPLIKRKDGKFEYLRAPINLVLAAMSGMPYGINTIKLEPGDIVYLYTDGVTEGVNEKEEQFGEQRLLDVLNKKEYVDCKDICEHVYEECVKFAGEADQFDDITMVAFKFKELKK